ncbi:MAG: hypothetical protein K9J37_14765 [Saprospiraceae bacterium]|nr:hypothetical protein [Saprospiraceae bacterium]MCF8251170.1 hypothetical protein [Saprospiraceae bacterium]MCF8281893.1 hypothetical protein [Bacteroidales bacterium]MCF8312982.1 hypothetical protein [Saprospiraceae bacterium]MCF8441429.1 hypothetical protein [Saprospiraceae bacterium]
MVTLILMESLIITSHLPPPLILPQRLHRQHQAQQRHQKWPSRKLHRRHLNDGRAF